MADGNTQNDLIDLQVEEEALERYYRQRIHEIKHDERPVGGTFIPLAESELFYPALAVQAIQALEDPSSSKALRTL